MKRGHDRSIDRLRVSRVPLIGKIQGKAHVTSWLKGEVVPAYLKMKANPERALTREESEARLTARRTQRKATKKESAA